MMNWRHISLLLAALAGAVCFWQIAAGGGLWRVVLAGVMALAFGLEWIGVPPLGRIAEVLRDRRKGIYVEGSAEPTRILSIMEVSPDRMLVKRFCGV